jgi:ABC-2 type transport system ATP-binding protein
MTSHMVSTQDDNDGSVIEIRDLVKVAGRDTRALNGITFDVARCELFGFMGANGACMTTTIRILATLLRPSAPVSCVGTVR